MAASASHDASSGRDEEQIRAVAESMAGPIRRTGGIWPERRRVARLWWCAAVTVQRTQQCRIIEITELRGESMESACHRICEIIM
jgi:hypothetical protein